MNLITLDWETYYDQQFSLRKMTTQEYILDERFEEIGVGIKINDGPSQWFSGSRKYFAKVLAEIDWADSALLCQNTMFDAAILAWHYGVRPKLLLDTMAMSRALYPHEKGHSLQAQAQRMGVGVKGSEVEDAKGFSREDFSASHLAQYGKYCKNDCDLTYDLFQKYASRMPKGEIQLIDATLRCYTEPEFQIEGGLLRDQLQELKVSTQMVLERVRNVLDMHDSDDKDVSRKLASNKQFAEVLEAFGVVPPMKTSPTTGKQTFAFAKTDEKFKLLEEHENPDVQVLVAARLGTKSTIESTRTERLIRCADLAQEVPIALRYYGAWTGRWSGDSAGATNFQNMPRKAAMKKAIVAPEGHVICGADLSNIELRLGLWLAGQEDKVQLIRDGRDLYKDLASRVNHVGYDDVPDDMRQTFKVVNLSAIYGTGAVRLQNTLRVMAGQKLTKERCKELIDSYREENDRVVDAWDDCRWALQGIIEGKEPELFRGLVKWDKKVQGFLLPSGLHLQMPNLRVELNEDGKNQFVFDGKLTTERTYGGKVFQGLTQAIARCIIATGWRRINKVKRIALSVHDSLYWLDTEENAEQSVMWGLKEMTRPLSWCSDLPLGAEGEFGKSLKGGSKTYKV